MQIIPLNLFTWLLALVPIVVVLVLMIGIRLGGSKAGPLGWLTAVLISILFYGATPILLLYSQLKGLFLTLHVLYIIWMALILYNVVNEAGAIEVIGKGIARLTSDRILQLLIRAWVFSSFLQGVAGFGVPIAVVAPLLIAMGFDPVIAVSAVAIGHSWSVTFGDMASSFQALIAVTGLPSKDLALWSATFLSLATFGCGFGVVHIYGGWKVLRNKFVAILLIGSCMAGTQFVLATNNLYTLAGFMAGLAGIIIGLVLIQVYSKNTVIKEKGDKIGLGLSLLPYIILIFIVSIVELWPLIHKALYIAKLGVIFPELSTKFGWKTPAGPGKMIPVFGHPGALLLYSSIFSFMIFQWKNYYSAGALYRILNKTIRSAIPSSIGIASMVGMAVIMDHSGMTYRLAQGISTTVGKAYPLISPLIGMLGAFMTGSNTNSNVIFAPLQLKTAKLIGINFYTILGAQTTGGALGSMLAPAKIIVGCSTAGLAGQEGKVLRKTIGYGLGIAIIVGVFAWVAIYIYGF